MDVHIINLGCARNQVDSENMAGELRLAGWSLTDDAALAEVIVVNTCSFIKAAADESIDTILALARFKETGCCRRLLVIGCLPERYREAISPADAEVPASSTSSLAASCCAGITPSGSTPRSRMSSLAITT